MADQKFPVTLYKGEQTRQAHTAGDLVRLQFDGFTDDKKAGRKLENPAPPEPARATPTAQTKAAKAATS